jgi:hypothetical protein
MDKKGMKNKADLGLLVLEIIWWLEIIIESYFYIYIS